MTATAGHNALVRGRPRREVDAGYKEGVAVKNQLLGGPRRSACSVLLAALLSGLAGCGGSQYVQITHGGQPAKFAYITVADSQNLQLPGTVYEYAIGSDGSLAPLSATSVPTGARPFAITSDPGGHYIYVVNEGDGTISQYAVEADGHLSALSPASVGISGAIIGGSVYRGISVDPSGHFVYVTVTAQDPAPGCTVAQYSIGSDGALVPLAPPTQNLAVFGSGPLIIHPSGQFAYLVGITADSNSRLSEYSRDANGVLTPLNPATVSNTPNAIDLYVIPSGQTAYMLEVCVTTNCNGRITGFAIGADGVLTSTGNVSVTASHVIPVAMVTDGTGLNAYLLANLMGVDTNDGVLFQYVIDDTGALVADTPASLGVASGAVALSTDGHNLYALSANAIGSGSGSPSGGYVDHYVIGSGGQLSASGTTSVSGSLPTSMTLVTTR
jgi:hypothetical protein